MGALGWLSQLSVRLLVLVGVSALMCAGTSSVGLCAQRGLLQDSLPLPLPALAFSLSLKLKHKS